MVFNIQTGRNGYVQCLKGNKPELRFVCSAHCLIMLYICVKFGENISDGIRVMERIQMMKVLADGWTVGHSKFQTV